MHRRLPPRARPAASRGTDRRAARAVAWFPRVRYWRAYLAGAEWAHSIMTKAERKRRGG